MTTMYTAALVRHGKVVIEQVSSIEGLVYAGTTPALAEIDSSDYGKPLSSFSVYASEDAFAVLRAFTTENDWLKLFTLIQSQSGANGVSAALQLRGFINMSKVDDDDL